MQTNNDKVREEFAKAYRIYQRDFGINMGLQKTTDWWLAKLSSALEEQKENLLSDLQHDENHFCKKYGEQFKECARCYVERKLISPTKEKA